MKLDNLLHATGGQALSRVLTAFSGIGTDSRQSLHGQIFFALRGERFDAHEFLAQAVQNGASCLVVDREPPPIAQLSQTVSIVRVADTLKALQDYARYWRRQQKAQVLSITGSNGKTTTKQFLAT